MKIEFDTNNLQGESNKANILGELLRAIAFKQNDTTYGASSTFDIQSEFVAIPRTRDYSKVLVIQKDLDLSPDEFPDGMYFASIGRGTFCYVAWINDGDTLLYFRLASLMTSLVLINDDAKKSDNWKIK